MVASLTDDITAITIVLVRECSTGMHKLEGGNDLLEQRDALTCKTLLHGFLNIKRYIFK